MKLSLRAPRLEKVREALRSRAGALRGGGRLLPRREILFVALAAVASAAITLIILTVSFNAREQRAARQVAQVPTAAQAPAPRELSADDFVLPAVPPPGGTADFFPFRPRLLQWSQENVDRFWVSPRQIAADAIAALNDRNMEGFFQKVK